MIIMKNDSVSKKIKVAAFNENFEFKANDHFFIEYDEENNVFTKREYIDVFYVEEMFDGSMKARDVFYCVRITEEGKPPVIEEVTGNRFWLDAFDNA